MAGSPWATCMRGDARRARLAGTVGGFRIACHAPPLCVATWSGSSPLQPALRRRRRRQSARPPGEGPTPEDTPQAGWRDLRSALQAAGAQPEPCPGGPPCRQRGGRRGLAAGGRQGYSPTCARCRCHKFKGATPRDHGAFRHAAQGNKFSIVWLAERPRSDGSKVGDWVRCVCRAGLPVVAGTLHGNGESETSLVHQMGQVRGASSVCNAGIMYLATCQDGGPQSGHDGALAACTPPRRMGPGNACGRHVAERCSPPDPSLGARVAKHTQPAVLLRVRCVSQNRIVSGVGSGWGCRERRCLA